MRTPKLSPAQNFIIDKLKEGWELSWNLSTPSGGYCVIRSNSNDLNKLKSEWVNKSTVDSLMRKGLITYRKREYNCTYYKLVEHNNEIK